MVTVPRWGSAPWSVKGRSVRCVCGAASCAVAAVAMRGGLAALRWYRLPLREPQLDVARPDFWLDLEALG